MGIALYLAVVVIVRIFTSGESEVACEWGWIMNHDNCFGYEGYGTWYDAFDMCARVNALIVSCKTHDEMAYLRTLMPETNKEMYRGMWLNAKDDVTEGNWIWQDTNTTVNTVMWYEEDYNDNQPDGNIVENCMSLRPKEEKWWDERCTKRFFVVCVKPATEKVCMQMSMNSEKDEYKEYPLLDKTRSIVKVTKWANNAGCTYNKWGFNTTVIWIYDGCGGDFQVCYLKNSNIPASTTAKTETTTMKPTTAKTETTTMKPTTAPKPEYDCGPYKVLFIIFSSLLTLMTVVMFMNFYYQRKQNERHGKGSMETNGKQNSVRDENPPADTIEDKTTKSRRSSSTVKEMIKRYDEGIMHDGGATQRADIVNTNGAQQKENIVTDPRKTEEDPAVSTKSVPKQNSASKIVKNKSQNREKVTKTKSAESNVTTHSKSKSLKSSGSDRSSTKSQYGKAMKVFNKYIYKKN